MPHDGLQKTFTITAWPRARTQSHYPAKADKSKQPIVLTPKLQPSLSKEYNQKDIVNA